MKRQQKIIPGAAGTIPASKTSPALMGCGGPGKPERVICAGYVMHYVGIGWVKERAATQADTETLQVVVKG